LGRIRASSSEWRQYYERATRLRCLRGDPFRKIWRRRRILGRVGKCGATCAAVFAFTVIVVGGLWLSDHVSVRPIIDMLVVR
jgi:hypothetical protein